MLVLGMPTVLAYTNCSAGAQVTPGGGVSTKNCPGYLVCYYGKYLKKKRKNKCETDPGFFDNCPKADIDPQLDTPDPEGDTEGDDSFCIHFTVDQGGCGGDDTIEGGHGNDVLVDGTGDDVPASPSPTETKFASIAEDSINSANNSASPLVLDLNNDGGKGVRALMMVGFLADLN